MNVRAALRRTATAAMTFVAVLLWFFAWLVSAPGDDAAVPGGSHHLPPITVGPGDQVINDPSLPYTFTVPTGFAVKPFPPVGVLALAPESWLPTTAAISISTEHVAIDADEASLDELAASHDLVDGPSLAERGLITAYDARGFRVLVANLGDDRGGRLYVACHGDTVITIVANPPDPAIDAYDPTVFPEAVDTILAGLAFR